MVHRLTEHNTIANQFLSELRDMNVQNDRLRFRRNLERLGEIFAYEISKTLSYSKIDTPTVLGDATSSISKDRVVLATILRAGLALHQGLLSYFDYADCAFASAYRKHEADGTFTIAMQYMTCPDLTGAILIISDPMLASGSSLKTVIDALLSYGKPKAIHIVSVIAADAGVAAIKRKYPNAHIWVGDIDPELTAKSYIVPGLGDAGDLAYGEKLQS